MQPATPDLHHDTPLAALMARLEALAAMPLPPAAVALVAEAVALAQALGPTDRPQIDRAIFDNLLSLAGPQVAPELLRQLAEDLAGVAASLPTALAAQDRAALRAQTHVLMALAGSVGAGPLYEAATRLNLVAHGSAPLAEATVAVRTGLARLRVFIDDACADAPQVSDPRR